MKHRSKMEIQEQFVAIFKAVKVSKSKGLRYVDMMKAAFNHDRKTSFALMVFDSHFDRGILTVHHKNFFKNGIIKCKDGRYRCVGYTKGKI